MSGGRLGVLLLLVWTLPAFAKDRKPPRSLFIQEVRQVKTLSNEKAGKAFALLGQVAVEVPGLFHLRAQRMVVWLDPEADTTLFDLVRGAGREEGGLPLWAVRSIYAEGGVVPAVFQTGGRIFRCSSLFYDFDSHKGLILDAALRLRLAGERTDLPNLVLRARKFRSTGPGRWRARDVTFFGSDYQRSELVIEVRRVIIEDREVAKQLGRLAEIRARGHREGRGATRQEVEEVLAGLQKAASSDRGRVMDLYGITGRLYDVPFAYWGHVHMDGDEVFPLYVQFSSGGRGRLGSGGRVGVGQKSKPVGWLAGVGYFKSRGPLFDLELKVDALGGRLKGRSFGVYLNDNGSDRGIVPPTTNRYWIKNQGRFEISEHWRLDGEYADLSDSQWLRTYDEREFKEGKEQESLLYLRGRYEQGYLTLTAKGRSIGFLDTTEEIPRLRAELPALTLLQIGEDAHGEPVTLQLAMTAELADLRHRRGQGSTVPDFRTVRADLDPTLQLAFSAGPVRVVPFASLRLTAYEQALDGASATRLAATAGLRSDVQLSRWYGSWRHVMNISLEAVDLYHVSEPHGALFAFDDVDRQARYEMLGVRWRHRLQRRTPRGIEEIVSLEFFGAWFPGGQRPLGRRGDGFAETDLEWRLRRDILLSARTEVDLERGRLETASVGSRWQARRNVALQLGLRHLEGDSDILTTALDVNVDTRWRVLLLSQFDLKARDTLDHGLLIQRLGKTVVVGLRFRFDPGDNDFSFGIKFDLLQLYRKRQKKRERNPRREIGWR